MGYAIGCAVKKIDMPAGLELAGYIARCNPGAEGVHDELEVKCLVIGGGKERIALVSCELIGLDSVFARETVRIAADGAHIPEDNILLHCTHTHSGPASLFLIQCGAVNENWLKGLQHTIVDCILEAAQQAIPVCFSYKTGTCSIGYNRLGHSLLSEARSREGGSDSQVGVLTFYEKDNGKILAVLVNYACHPVVLTHTNMLYSADYPHYMEETIKKHLPEDACVIFMNGCCGDIDPVKRGTFELAREAGEQLAKSILEVMEPFCPANIADPAALSVKAYAVRIPISHTLKENRLLELLSTFKDGLQKESLSGSDDVKAKVYKAYIEWAERLLKKVREGALEDHIDADVKLIRLGETAIVTLPFEAYHDVGEKIKKHLGPGNTLVFGYTNGCFGYLASAEQYPESRYEMEEAFRYYGYPGPFSRDAEGKIYRAVFS